MARKMTPTPVAFIADVHLGNHRIGGGTMHGSLNNRCLASLRVLEQTLDYCNEQGVRYVFILGDLFDESRPPSQLIAAVTNLFDLYPAMTIVCMVGNHDQHSDTENDNAMAALGRCQIVSAPTIIPVQTQEPEGEVSTWSIALIPYERGQTKEYWAAALDALFPGGSRNRVIIGGHAGLIEHTTPSYLRGVKDAIDVKSIEEMLNVRSIPVHMIAVGNWHNPRADQAVPIDGSGVLLVQCGALVPTGWDNEGMDYGRVNIAHLPAKKTSLGVFQKAIGGPRFIDISGGYFSLQGYANAIAFYRRRLQEEGCIGWLRVHHEVGQEAELHTIAATYANDEVIRYVELVPSTVSADAKMIEDVRSAVNSIDADIDQALGDYVRGLGPTLGEINPEELLSLVHNYLKEARRAL